LCNCLQVFLTMSPEEVMVSLFSLSSSSQLQYPTALLLAAREPLLLQQHPAMTAAALQQLQGMLPEQQLLQELLCAAPELLLMGQQPQQRLAAAAALLSLSVTQLAVALIKEPSLWWVLVPRHTWQLQQVPSQQQAEPLQQQQQQHAELSPAAALAVESMAALVACQLRPPAVMQQVAVLQPLLLKLGAASIQQRVQMLREACASSGHWQQQLQASLDPQMLGHALMRITYWRRRMEFLVQFGMSDRLQLTEVIGMKRWEFEKYFSFEYSGWKLEGKHQQRRAAAAAAYTRYAQTGEGQQEQQQQQQQQRLAWLQQQRALQQQQQQQPQAGQQQQLDQFVDVLQAFAASGRSTGAGTSSSSSGGSRDAGDVPDLSNAALLQGQQQEQQQQWQQWQQHGEGDDQVFYLEEEEWQQQESSSSSDGSSRQDDRQSSPSQQQRDAFKPGWEVRQHSVQLIQSDDDDDGDDGEQAHVHTHVPLLFKSDMQLLAVQQSAVELYGSWEGCLVQPGR
jgi:hypothetical protein